MDAQTIAEALGGKHTGNRWLACCPAHNDKHPSLSITETDSGKVLVKCFAGCSQEEVIRELRNLGLWPEQNKLPDNRLQAYQSKRSRHEMESALNHELNVLIQFVGWRVADREAARDSKYRTIRPDWKPMPEAPWERELLAIRRIRNAMVELYE